MNKQAEALLAKINAKKEEVKNIALTGNLAATKAAKKELDDMQETFDCIKDLDDTNTGAARAAAAAGSALVVNGPTVKEKAKAFVGMLVASLRKEQPSEEDARIYNSMKEESGEVGKEGKNGGLTVPKDIDTEIRELRRSQDNLEQYVNVEPVSTLSGSRVVEEDAEDTPWDNVEEEKAFPEVEGPTFRDVKYKVTKKGGILKITQELLDDTAENILRYLKKYIAKKTKVTRNAFILKALKDIVKYGQAGSTVKPIKGIDGLKDIFNVELDPAVAAGAIVITNQSGLNMLDKMKDDEGNYILQKDPTMATRKVLFGAYPIVALKNKTLASIDVKDSQQKVTAHKHPFIIGDLKEVITLFDREKMTIDINANVYWENDQTGIKVRDRFDVKTVDEKAFVFGEMTETVA